MGHLLFGVNSFFRFASKNRTSMLPFSRPRRGALRRGTNYIKAWFWNARGVANKILQDMCREPRKP